MTERERLRTLGMYYWGVTRNYQKAIETYETLVEKYPADSVGHNNLAVQYLLTLDFQNARREGQIALDIYPNDTLTRSNYALYAMYASDFDSAVAAAQPLLDQEEIYFKAWLPIAMDAVAGDDLDAATTAYRNMSLAGDRGKSTAAQGLADLEIFSGNFVAARDILINAIGEDEMIGSSYGMASKYMALAEAFFGLGDRAAALAAIEKGTALSGADAIVVPAALMFIEAGETDAATSIPDTLAGRLQPQSRAYAEMIQAVQLLDRNRHLEAIDKLTAAISVADLWLLRFHLGRAYLKGDFHAEALDEFMALRDRQGEATAIFLDELPTYRYVATLPYWLGRAQAGLGMTQDAGHNFKLFLSRRPYGGPLAADARQRLE
jgi:tetratricopeptide (TPR) repeat protein